MRLLSLLFLLATFISPLVAEAAESRVENDSAREAYAPTLSQGKWAFENPRQGWTSRFGANGARIEHDLRQKSAALEIRLSSIGRGPVRAPVVAGEVVLEGDRVEIRRPGVVEWFVNSPAGLEQGFDLLERPAGDGMLEALLWVGGADVRLEGGEITLTTDAGRQLGYGKLEVRDDAGMRLVARFANPEPGLIRIEVDDRQAKYPIEIDPLLTGQAATVIDGNASELRFGRLVRRAGDVNGDGFEDVLVLGYPRPPVAQDGKVFVFHGSAAGIIATTSQGADTTITIPFESGPRPWGCGPAGDVNGDGYSDILVKGWADDGFGNATEAILVFHGGSGGIPSGTIAAADSVILSDASDFRTAGDVNGDGYGDLLIGDEFYENDDDREGGAWLYLGGAAGIPSGSRATANGVFEGDRRFSLFGTSVAGVGDLNGDGFGDIVIGGRWYLAPPLNVGAEDGGGAAIFYGGPTGISTGSFFDNDGLIDGWGQFGARVEPAGDVNGDGFDDLAIAAPIWREHHFNGGGGFVFHGGAAGVTAVHQNEAATVLRGEAEFAYFGDARSAGDLDADGYADLLVTSPADAFNTSLLIYKSGVGGLGAELLAGDADIEIQPVVLPGGLGGSRDSAGDVDGDGLPDVIVKAPEAVQFEGAVHVYLADSDGTRARARQYRSDDGLLLPTRSWAISGVPSGLEVGLIAEHPDVDGSVLGEFEACPSGTPFGDPACAVVQSPTWLGVSAASPEVEVPGTFAGLANNKAYKWRARPLFAPPGVAAGTEPPPASPTIGPWRRPFPNGPTVDVRIGLPEPGFAAGLSVCFITMAWGGRSRRPSA